METTKNKKLYILVTKHNDKTYNEGISINTIEPLINLIQTYSNNIIEDRDFEIWSRQNYPPVVKSYSNPNGYKYFIEEWDISNMWGAKFPNNECEVDWYAHEKFN